MCCFVVVVRMVASLARSTEFQTQAARTCDHCPYLCPYSRHSQSLASPRPSAAYSTEALSRSDYRSVPRSRGTSEPLALCVRPSASTQTSFGLQKLGGFFVRSLIDGSMGFTSLRGVFPRTCTVCCGSLHSEVF